jgi:hypothetical protein
MRNPGENPGDRMLFIARAASVGGAALVVILTTILSASMFVEFFNKLLVAHNALCEGSRIVAHRLKAKLLKAKVQGGELLIG